MISMENSVTIGYPYLCHPRWSLTKTTNNRKEFQEKTYIVDRYLNDVTIFFNIGIWYLDYVTEAVKRKDTYPGDHMSIMYELDRIKK